METSKKLSYSPTIGYYDKGGLGITAVGYIVNDNSRMNFYQYSFSPSYDLIKRKLSTGISYTRYFSKDSLDFYATPIQNELYTYFSWKKWWMRPTI